MSSRLLKNRKKVATVPIVPQTDYTLAETLSVSFTAGAVAAVGLRGGVEVKNAAKA